MKGSGLLNALLVAAALAVCAGTASAATYYVDCDDPTARDVDEQDATKEATPWKTPWWAGIKAKAGDTVLVKGTNCPDPETAALYGDNNQAVYLEQKGDDPNGGTPKWTYFKAYPGYRPNIRFKVPKVGINVTGGSYIWIEGFEISPEDYQKTDYCGGHNIWIGGGHHIVIRNCNIHGSPVGGVAAAWADYLTIENNTVWDNCKWSSSNSSGIHFYQLYDSKIDYGATTVNGTDYRIIIANNRIYDNEATMPPSTKCFPWLSVPFPTYPVDGNGIALDDFGNRQVYDNSPDWMKEHKDVLYPHRTLIMNNLIYGNGGRGIQADAGYVDVMHNTVYSNLQNKDMRENSPAAAEFGIGGIDMRIFNNIVFAQYNNTLWLKYDNPFVGHPVGTEKKIVYGNNLTYGQGNDTDTNATDAGGNFTQDPRLAAPSLLGDADFHLKKGSPAINKGSAANSVPTDFEGKTRPIGGLPDIGAYETNYLGGGMCVLPAIKFLLDGK